MAGLDFKRCSDLFLGSERELALALGIALDEVTRLRGRPEDASDTVLLRLAQVLEERGQGMQRVAEMLREQTDADSARGNGASRNDRP